MIPNHIKNNLPWARTLLILTVALIFAGSSVPSKNIPGIFSLTPDKLIHCAEYAVLGFFLFHWLRLEFISSTSERLNLSTFFIGSLIGIADENYQRLTPGRTPNFWDWVLDSIGVLLVILLMTYLLRRSTNRKGSTNGASSRS
jgi:VanZ family protein